MAAAAAFALLLLPRGALAGKHLFATVQQRRQYAHQRLARCVQSKNNTPRARPPMFFLHLHKAGGFLAARAPGARPPFLMRLATSARNFEPMRKAARKITASSKRKTNWLPLAWRSEQHGMALVHSHRLVVLVFP